MNKKCIVSKEKLKKYFSITNKALSIAKKAINKKREKEALAVIDMAQKYCEDANFFEKKADYVSALSAINYAHGWLDAGSKLGLFKVKDSKLFVLR